MRISNDALAELVSHLEWLIGRCAIARIKRIVLPFVDASRLDTTEDHQRVLAILTKILPLAKATG